MKKIILLLLIMLSIYSCKQEVKEFGIVTKVELCDDVFASGYKAKYKVTASNFNAIWRGVEAVIYTNELYIVGDTIIVTNKNNLKDKNYEQRN